MLDFLKLEHDLFLLFLWYVTMDCNFIHIIDKILYETCMFMYNGILCFTFIENSLLILIVKSVPVDLKDQVISSRIHHKIQFDHWLYWLYCNYTVDDLPLNMFVDH